jgi:hypothetical protein
MKKIISILLGLGTFTSNAWADTYSCRPLTKGLKSFQYLELALQSTGPLQVSADVMFRQTDKNLYYDPFTPTKFNGQLNGRVHPLHNGKTMIALNGVTTSDEDGSQRWSSLLISEVTLKHGIIERLIDENRISGESRLTENIQWTCMLMNQKKECSYGKCGNHNL